MHECSRNMQQSKTVYGHSTDDGAVACLAQRKVNTSSSRRTRSERKLSLKTELDGCRTREDTGISVTQHECGCKRWLAHVRQHWRENVQHNLNVQTQLRRRCWFSVTTERDLRVWDFSIWMITHMPVSRSFLTALFRNYTNCLRGVAFASIKAVTSEPTHERLQSNMSDSSWEKTSDKLHRRILCSLRGLVLSRHGSRCSVSTAFCWAFLSRSSYYQSPNRGNESTSVLAGLCRTALYLESRHSRPDHTLSTESVARKDNNRRGEIIPCKRRLLLCAIGCNDGKVRIIPDSIYQCCLGSIASNFASALSERTSDDVCCLSVATDGSKSTVAGETLSQVYTFQSRCEKQIRRARTVRRPSQRRGTRRDICSENSPHDVRKTSLQPCNNSFSSSPTST